MTSEPVNRELANAAAPRWEHFHHGADIGVRGVGPTREIAFAQAALAAMGVIADPKTVRANELAVVHCDAADDELLLADWLNAIVYEMATRNMLFSRFEVVIRDHHLDGRMWGEKVDRGRHQPAVEIKGATYTELWVRREGDQWIAQCVVDV